MGRLQAVQKLPVRPVFGQHDEEDEINQRETTPKKKKQRPKMAKGKDYLFSWIGHFEFLSVSSI